MSQKKNMAIKKRKKISLKKLLKKGKMKTRIESKNLKNKEK